MIRSYIKIALRNIKKQKAFSVINITGLAVGMACCVLIFLWVKDELSYDRFHENHRSLYMTIVNVDGEWWTSSPWALAPILKQEYPEILKSSRFARRNVLLSNVDNSFYEDVAFVDPDFFEMFTYPLLKGHQESVFSALESVVVSESAARKFFGNEDPLGKTLTLNNQLKLTVTGLVKDPPSNSHMSFSLLAPVKLFGEEKLNTWAVESNSYVLLQENISLDTLREKIAGVVAKYDTRTEQSKVLDLWPITRIHLYSLRGGGDILYVYLFSTIAVFVLLIACMNFMNLSTARGGVRAKEVGLRKVVGARRINVIRQFFGESLLLSFMSMLVALNLVYLVLPGFNSIAQKDLRFDLLGNIIVLIGLFIITLFTGVISGSYPALFLSAFQPANVLKGAQASGSKKPVLRRVLVVTQFTIAIVFIIGTLIVYKQLNFIRNRDLGFNREHVISLSMNKEIGQNYEAFKNALLLSSDILHVTSAVGRPTSVGNINPVYWEGRGPDQYEIMKFISADHDYIETFEMEIVAGRDFSRDFSTDRENYIVNQEAVKFMGLEDPVGKLFSIWQDEGKIIGVVKNFHSRSLHNEIEPIVITLRQQNWGPAYLFVRVKPKDISQTLSYVEETWKKFSPNHPFQIQFLDEAFNQLYRADQRTGTIFKYFTILAIFISCLGIFGLAAYTAEQRTKEIGVRKVLGATVSNLVRLVSREFMILVTLANVIAWPVAYVLVSRLLNSYAYRTGISAWVFLLAGILAYGIALMTVSYQALKAAHTDPANALRYE